MMISAINVICDCGHDLLMNGDGAGGFVGICGNAGVCPLADADPPGQVAVAVTITPPVVTAAATEPAA